MYSDTIRGAPSQLPLSLGGQTSINSAVQVEAFYHGRRLYSRRNRQRGRTETGERRASDCPFSSAFG